MTRVWVPLLIPSMHLRERGRPMGRVGRCANKIEVSRELMNVVSLLLGDQHGNEEEFDGFGIGATVTF